MARAPFNAPATPWKPVLDKRAEEAAKNAKPEEVLSERDGLQRMADLFDKSATADRMQDTKRCTRATENGACGHSKLKADLYCEVHKNPGLFAATGYTDYTFFRHAAVERDVKDRLAALKPSV